MAAADTAKLIASLVLDDKMSKGLSTAERNLGKFESTSFRVGQHIGRGFQNAAANIAKLGVAAAGVVTGAVVLGVRSLGDLQRATEQTAAVIASTGGKAGVSATQVRSLAESLENLSTVDDKVIQDGENMLLTFTGIGKDVFPRATKAALNMAVAMAGGNVEAVDLKASAIQLGKALNDPVKGITALRKVGVAFTADQVKQIKALVKTGDVLGAQTIILKELETEFGNAAAAAGKGPEASWRRLQDVGEDLSQSIARGLLPVLTKAADWLSSKLADPAVIRRIDALGVSLGEAGDKVLAFIQTVDFDSLADSLGTAVGFAGQLVSAFLGMPDWVKTAILTGWGLNKLTGGAVTGIIGELSKGLIKGILGMNAGVVNINAGVVNGAGGVPGVAGAAKGGLGLASKVFLIGEAIGLAAIVNEVRQDQANQRSAQAAALAQQNAQFLAQKPDRAALLNALQAVDKGINDIQANPLNVLIQGSALDELKKMRADIASQLSGQGTTVGDFGRTKPDPRATTNRELEAIEKRAIAAGFRPTADQIRRTFERNTSRQEAASRAVVAANRETAFATRDAAMTTTRAIDRTTAAVQALPSQLRNALGGLLHTSTNDRPSKDDRIVPRTSTGPEIRNGFVINAKVSIPTRDVNTSQTLRSRIGPTPTQAGAA